MKQDPPDLEITAAGVLAMLDRTVDCALLLDVREHYELGRGILPGAKVVPMSQLEAQWQGLPRDQKIVCYCEHGVRSLHVAAFLQQQGFDIVSMEDGFAEWTGPTTPVDPGTFSS